MKTVNYIFTALCVMVGYISTAQEKRDTSNKYVVVEHDYEIKTLFGGNHTNGFYISYDLGFANMDKNQTVETGGRLAWVVDHSVAIGLFGSGFVSASDFDKVINGSNSTLSLAGGYGGFLIEPIIMPKKPIHISLPIMIGVGGAGYDSYSYNNNSFEYYGNSSGDAFMMLKAGAEVELNLLKFLRLGIGAQYRYVYGLNLEGFGKNDLNGISATMAFKFGKF